MKRLSMALAFVLAGCLSVLPDPAPTYRVLDAGAVAPAQGAGLDRVLAVTPPQGKRLVLDEGIVWRAGDEAAYVKGSQWAGRAQDLLLALMIETATRQQRFRAVVRAGEARADAELRWDLLDFEIVAADGGQSAHFRADVKLVDMASRRVIAADIVAVETPLASRSASAASEALARAAREGGARIGVFAADALAETEAQESAASISR